MSNAERHGERAVSGSGHSDDAYTPIPRFDFFLVSVSLSYSQHEILSIPVWGDDHTSVALYFRLE